MAFNNLRIYSLILALLLFSCGKEERVPVEGGELVVHLAEEPDRLNPVLSTSAYGSQIDRFIFQALYDYDPYTLEYIPVLAEDEVVVEQRGEGDSLKMIYTYRIKEEALWPDGEPVAAADYLFTLKVIFNPKVNAARMRSYLSFIDSVRTFPGDPKKLSISTDGQYFLNEQIVSNFMIMPRHVYDPEGLMSEFRLSDLMDPETSSRLAESSDALNRFAALFNSQEFSRETVVGSGPYRFVEWLSGQRILLERKSDWWGEREGSNPFFTAYPERLVYRVIPDETVALTSLKDGSIDVMTQVSPENFKNLKEDSTYNSRFYFHTPTLMQFVYIALNTRDPKLEDRRVREALAYLVDMDYIVQDLFKGFATPTVGAINPGKQYYHEGLEPRDLQPDRASDLLAEAGWDDSDGDGIVDKSLGGTETELELKLKVSGGLGEKLALRMQESFRAAGIDLAVERKSFSLIRDELRTGDYEMAALLLSQSPALTDLYQSWHSSNINLSGGNTTGFGTAASDSIIEEIRVASDPSVRNRLYREIQEIMYEEVPSLFLVSPQGRILVSKDWQFKPALLRPGVFEQNLQQGR